MAGGWLITPQWNNPQDCGTSGVGLSGVGSPGTTFTKGGWSQLVAATTADTAAVMLEIIKTANNSTAAFDIGIGAAGSEVAIVSNLSIQSPQQTAVVFQFPLAIRAGTRVATRLSTEGTYQNVYYRMTLFDDSVSASGIGSAVDTYGFNTAANIGVAVDPGATSGAKGSYSQIAASVSNDLAGFFLAFDTQGRLSGSGQYCDNVMDIAVGAAGSETVILPNTWNYLQSGSGTSQTLFPNTGYFPIPVRAGSRIAARLASNTNVSPDRILGVTLYGVRQ